MVPGTGDDVAFLASVPNPGSLVNPLAISLSLGSVANSLSVYNNYSFSGGDLALTSGAISISFLQAATITSQLNGTAGLTLVGTGSTGRGTLYLSNATNGYTGTTTIAGGTLVIDSAGALGTSASTISVTGASTAGLNGGALYLAGGYGTGFNLGRALTLSGGGPTASSVNGPALISRGDNSITGAISSGTTSIGAGIHSTFGTLTLGAMVINGTAGSNFTTFGSSSSVGNYVLTGAISGTGSIQKSGKGTLTLSGNTSNFAGTIRISDGSVRVASPGSFGSNTGTGTSAPIDLNGGILEIRTASTPTIGTNVFGRDSSTLFVDHGIGTLNINQTATFGGLSFTGAETYSFRGRNGYGMEFASNALASPTASSNVTFGNDMNGLLLFTSSVWGTTAASAATITFTGAGTTQVNGGISASGNAAHALNKSGSGKLTIAGVTSTFQGTVTIADGTLEIGDFRSINLSASSAIVFGNLLSTNPVLVIGVAGTTPTAAGLITSRPLSILTATTSATVKANQTGSDPVVFQSTNAISVGTSGNKSLILSGTNTADNEIRGILGNPGASQLSLTKTDVGTWQLSGSNGYTGATTITAGTLKLKGNAASSTILSNSSAIVFGADATTQNAGGTLEFMGVSGTSTTETLGVLTPTAGAGTIRLKSGSALSSANLIFSSLGTVNGASGVNFDTSAAAGGTVTLNGVATTTATTLPGNGHLYINGADFARSVGGTLVAPVYGTDAGFVVANDTTNLIANSHNFASTSITAASSRTITSLKLSNFTTVNAINLTVNTGSTSNDGGILVTNGNVTLAVSQLSSGGSGALVFRVNLPTDQLTIWGNMSVFSTGGFTKNGAGTLVLWGDNAQSGPVNINEGTVRLLFDSTRLALSSSPLTIRQGAILDMGGHSFDTFSEIGSFNGAGTVINTSSTAATFAVGGNNGTGTFTGSIDESNGRISFSKFGTGSMTWSGTSTYTGPTKFFGPTGLVSVATLADTGSPSGIGKGIATSDAENAASLVFAGTTSGINYIGTTSVSIDRMFTLNSTISGGGGQIANASSNNSTLIFSKTSPIAFGGSATVPQTLTLGGSSSGDNTLNLQIIDNLNGGSPLATSVSKIGTGIWILGNAANSYSGTTSIAGGILNAQDGQSLPSASGLILGSTAASGILESSGTFTRSVVTSESAGLGTVSWNSNLTSGGGGFSASTSKLTVSLGGASPTPLIWELNGFFAPGSTGALYLNSTTALAEVELRNAIDLNNATRTIQMGDNPNTYTDFATISGVVSGNGGLNIIGNGMLQLLGANTYSGSTQISPGSSTSLAGTLVVNSLGNSGAAGAGSVGSTSNANLLSRAVILGNGNAAVPTLVYVGSGEVSDRYLQINTTTGDVQLVADGSGPLVLTNVQNSGATGNKRLLLRGSNAFANEISSALADNGGTLGIVHDTGGAWILSGNNSGMSGTVTASGGSLGAGSNTAFGTGTLSLSGTSIFAAGGDRQLGNAVNEENVSNGVVAFVGDYSLTFNGSWTNLTTTAQSRFLRNNITTGKTLTIAGSYTFTALTTGSNMNFDGSGDTIISGVISNSFGTIGITYAGSGSLTLGGANTYNGNTVITGGTLKLGNDNVIPDVLSTATATGNLVMIPGLNGSRLDLNGHSETINGLAATSVGVSVIDNSSAGPATFTFGANDQSVQFVPSGFTGRIENTGGGPLSLVKIGSGSATIGNAALTYTGSTSVAGGSLLITSPLNGTQSLSATGVGSNLTLAGGWSDPGMITSLVVGAGAATNFLDGLGTPLPALTTLNLGAGGGIATLGLELGTTVDTLVASAAAVATGGVQFKLTGLTGLEARHEYPLLIALSGLNGAAYSIGSQPGGFTPGSLRITDQGVYYTTGDAVSSSLYWNNTTGNGSWTTNNSGITNWRLDLAGMLEAGVTPGTASTVVFSTSVVTAGPIVTTLDADVGLDHILFTAAPSGVAGVTINPGTFSTSALTITPASATTGIDVATNAGAVVVNSRIVLGAAQTWNVEGGGANGSSLTVNGAVSGSGQITKTGAGTLTLGADNTFSAGLLVRSGTVIANSTNAFSPTHAVTLGAASGTADAAVFVGVNGLIVNVPIILQSNAAAHTLTVGSSGTAVSATYRGGIIGGNDVVLNNNGTTGILSFAVNPINNSGKVTNVGAGSGTTTITGGVGANVTEIIQNSTTSQLTLGTTALNVNPLGTTLTNVSGTRILSLSSGTVGTGDLIFKNNSSTNGGVSALTLPLNNTGYIINVGTGTGNVQITADIGTNVLGVIQNSATSQLRLTGAYSYLTPTTISAGKLSVSTLSDGGVAGTLGSSNSSAQNLVFDGGALLITLAGQSTNRHFTITPGKDAIIEVSNSATFTGGAASTTGGLQKTGSGTLTLTGTSDFTGQVFVDSGTLQFTTVSNNGGAASSLGRGTGGITLDGATLEFVGATSQSTDRAILVTASSTLAASGTSGATFTYGGTLTAGSSNLTLAGSGNGILTGAVVQTGGGDLVKQGTETWTIAGTSAINRDAYINAGTLFVTNANALHNDVYIRGGGSILKLGVNSALRNAQDVNVSAEFAGDGVLDINGTSGTGPASVIVGSSGTEGYVIDSVGGGLLTATAMFDFQHGFVYANLGGSAPLIKTSSGHLTLYGDNSAFTGATTITEGQLYLDYNTNSGEKLSNVASVTMQGAQLIAWGKDAATTVETVGGIVIAAGDNLINAFSSGGMMTLNGNSLTRIAGTGATVRLAIPTTGTFTTTTPNLNSLRMLGGWVTVYGNSGYSSLAFARNDESGVVGKIVAVVAAVKNNIATWTNGDHVTDSSVGYSGTAPAAVVIRSLRFGPNTSSTVTIGAGEELRIASGGVLGASGSLGGNINGGTLLSSVGELFLTSVGTPIKVGSRITGTTSVTVTGGGSVTLNGINDYTGTTYINAGALNASGTGIGDFSSVVIGQRVQTALIIVGNETIGTLSGGASGFSNLGDVRITGSLTVNQLDDAEYAGVFIGTTSDVLILNGPETLTLGGSSDNFFGSVVINGGILQTYGDPRGLYQAASFTLNGKTAEFLLTHSQTFDINHVSDSASITLNNTAAGNGFHIRNTDASGQFRNETFGSLILGAGDNTVFIDPSAPYIGAGARLTASQLLRQNNATFYLRGGFRDLGNGPTASMIVSGGVTSIGGGGAAGTTTSSIVPYVYGSINQNVGAIGDSFMAYDAGVGFRLLNLNDYVENATGFNALPSSSFANVRFDDNPGGSLAVGSKTINSLLIDTSNDTVVLTGASTDTLTLSSGAMLVTAALPFFPSPSISGYGAIATTSGEYVFQVLPATTSLTIGSSLSSPAALTKSGAGTLILTAANSYNGVTTINQGTLQAAGLGMLGTGPLIFAGGTFRMSGGWNTTTDDLSSKTLTFMSGGGTIDTFGLSPTFANPIGNDGAGGFTKQGLGTLTLLTTATYTGTTIIENGALLLAGGAANRLNSATSLTLGGGTSSGTIQLGDASAALDQTVSALAMAGTGTTNAVLGGNSSISTLTVNQSTNTVYAGRFGGATGNDNRLGLTKSGVGTLTLSGSTIAYVGSTTVNGGLLAITGSPSSPLQTSAIVVRGGAGLHFKNGVGQAIDLGSGTLTVR